MALSEFPENLTSLHHQEEVLRARALEIIAANQGLLLQLQITEQAMNVCDVFRQHITDDEDLKVVQIMSIRMFNALGTSLKLSLSGYSQTAALVMRDILETVFLVDLFAGEQLLITAWRNAPKAERWKHFKPAAVREALDKRDGFTSQKRRQAYDLFCDLAGHPNMTSHLMLRPAPEADAVSGPFMSALTLEAVVSELGRLAVQVGNCIVPFYPTDWQHGSAARQQFARVCNMWMANFYPDAYAARAAEVLQKHASS